MNLFALVVGLASVAELPTRQYVIELAICEGDPLGSKAAGNLHVFSRPTVQAAAGRAAYVHIGQDWEVPGPNGTTITRPLGVSLRVMPTPAPGGTVRLGIEFQHATVDVKQVVKLADGRESPTFNVEAVDTAVQVKPGVTTRVRLWAKSPADQMWVELTVRRAE